MKNIIAIICDCDETLSPDTTSLLLENNHIAVKPFWKDIEKSIKMGLHPPLAWMTKIFGLIQKGKIKQNTNQKLSNFLAHLARK